MLKKTLSGAINLLCVAAILLSIGAGWAVLTAEPNRPPTLFGNSFMVVISGSMEPKMPVGTLLLSHQVAPSQVEEGDIITFYGTVGSTTGIITHRVVEKQGTGDGAVLYTKGDANPIEDPNPVTRENLIGKVVWQSLLLGKLVALLRQKYVYLALVLIPLLVILLSNATKLVRLAKAEIRQAEEDGKEEDRDGN